MAMAVVYIVCLRNITHGAIGARHITGVAVWILAWSVLWMQHGLYLLLVPSACSLETLSLEI